MGWDGAGFVVVVGWQYEELYFYSSNKRFTLGMNGS